MNDKNVIGILSFEVASLMSKIAQIWRFLIENVDFPKDFIGPLGIRELLNNNNGVLDLIYAEVMFNCCEMAKIIVRLSKRCNDSRLKFLEHELEGKLLTMKNGSKLPFSCKKMDETIKKMETLVTANENLYMEMQEMMKLEDKLGEKSTIQSLFQLEQQIEAKEVQLSYLKTTLWNCTYDDIVLVLVRCLFTTFYQIELLFDVVHVPKKCNELVRGDSTEKFPNKRLVSLWSFSKVNRNNSPLESFTRCIGDHSVKRESNVLRNKIDFSMSDIRMPTPSFGTLGDGKLERIYANAIIEIENLVMLPNMITEAKIKEMKKRLPRSLRFVVWERLKSVQNQAVSLEAISRILGWLTPLAHNTLTKWMSEQRYAHQNVNTCGEKMLLQVETLCFADKKKTDAVVSELLVGLTFLAQRQLSDSSSDFSEDDE